jgi:type 2A phosphatase activator TIP41
MPHETSPAPIFTTKKEMYDWLEKQTSCLVENMSRRFTPQANLVIGLSNVAALCFYELNRFCNPGAPLEELRVNWFGFYLLQAPGVLALGPFQGRPACMEIRVGRGVCGTVAESGEALVVPDVHDFPGHIACDSASESEVVVPILIENGSVVGVIDVDSRVLGHFSAEDKEGLERVAAVLVQHLEFPMARALAVNPALGLPGYSALAGGEKALQQPKSAFAGGVTEKGTAETNTTSRTPASPTPVTTVTHIPYFKIEARLPDVTTKCVSGWHFTTTTLDKIMTQEEEKEMQAALHISSLPEIAFRNNTLAIGPETEREQPWLVFNVEGLLRSASNYYHTEEYRAVVAPQLSIPVSAGWQTTEYAKHDPNVDWAWRNNFYGLAEGRVRVVPRPPDTPGINWNLLKDNSLPILFYGSFDLVEDDLHDHGMLTSSVKYRVMESAFFVLFRHFIRVDNAAVWMREVRIYHEFSEKNSVTGMPHVVLLEQLRHASIAEPTEMDWRSMSPDAIAAQSAVLLTREWVLAKADS